MCTCAYTNGDVRWYPPGMTDNVEIRARAICSMDIARVSPPVADRQAAVDRYWPVVAREILVGATAQPVELGLSGEELAARTEEYRRLKR